MGNHTQQHWLPQTHKSRTRPTTPGQNPRSNPLTSGGTSVQSLWFSETDHNPSCQCGDIHGTFCTQMPPGRGFQDKIKENMEWGGKFPEETGLSFNELSFKIVFEILFWSSSLSLHDWDWFFFSTTEGK